MHYSLNDTDTFSLASLTIPEAPIACLQFTTDVHIDNTSSTAATGLLYKDLLLSGAGEFDRAGFLNAVNKLGASIGISYEQGMVTISLRAREKQFPRLLSLFSTMMQAPAMEQGEIKRARTVALNGLSEHEEDARSLAVEQLANSFFTQNDRRYHYDTKVLAKELEHISRNDLQTFHELVMSSFWTVSVVGRAITIEQTESCMRRLRAAHTTVERPARLHEPSAPKSHLVLRPVPSKQNIEFAIGGPLPLTLHHPDYLPFVFGLNVLGKWGGFTGRLMSTVREREGLTYGIYARTETVKGDETGFWRIFTFFSPKDAERGLASTMREVTKIHRSGITDSELERFKTILLTGQTLLQDSPVRALTDLHIFHIERFSIDEMLDYKHRLQSVTKEQVDQALKRYLDPKSMVISGAGPVKDVQKALQKQYQ